MTTLSLPALSRGITRLPATLAWFARHELLLSWRDFVSMMSAGRKGRERAVIVTMIVMVVALHLFAHYVLNPSFDTISSTSATTLAVVLSSIGLMFCMMVSQAMESVTRAFYTRSDLDLILSSPVRTERVFTVRILAIVTSTTLLSMGLAAPVLNVLAWETSAYWLAGYLVIPMLGAVATALALAITVALFKTLGARKTRLAAQVIAAIVGAGFIIGLQLAAIASIGSVSRFDFLASDSVQSTLPDATSLVWLPAKAFMGHGLEFVVIALVALLVILHAIRIHAISFADHVIEAAGISGARQEQKVRRTLFKPRSIRAALRAKEWTLLLRDKWLMSQTLMQILYLLPPAFMLWQSYGSAGAGSVVVVPILVMASGQLAGGLAWLAISGEDAPQLVATAPVSGSAIILAKVEAVLGAIGILTLPFLLVLLFQGTHLALAAICGIAAAAMSATLIQLWFRSQAKRSNFRRRQTSSRVATLAEAFSSIMWAGTAGLMAVGSMMSLVPCALAFMALFVAWIFKPENSTGI